MVIYSFTQMMRRLNAISIWTILYWVYFDLSVVTWQNSKNFCQICSSVPLLVLPFVCLVFQKIMSCILFFPDCTIEALNQAVDICNFSPFLCSLFYPSLLPLSICAANLGGKFPEVYTRQSCDPLCGRQDKLSGTLRDYGSVLVSWCAKNRHILTAPEEL